MKKMQKLARYIELYEKKSHSYVFAPLADIYRELGMLAEAKSVLGRGLEKYPEYLLGHIVAAKCFFDQSEFYQAYIQLRERKEQAKDNIMYWNLFSEICSELNFHEEQLESLRKLRELRPDANSYLDEKIARVESLIYRSLPHVKKQVDTPLEDWEYVDFNTSKASGEMLDQWEVN